MIYNGGLVLKRTTCPRLIEGGCYSKVIMGGRMVWEERQKGGMVAGGVRHYCGINEIMFILTMVPAIIAYSWLQCI